MDLMEKAPNVMAGWQQSPAAKGVSALQGHSEGAAAVPQCRHGHHLQEGFPSM